MMTVVTMLRGRRYHNHQQQLEAENIALNRGRTDRINLTHDLDHDV